MKNGIKSIEATAYSGTHRVVFFSKFVQTLNKQLEDGAGPRAVVYAGLLRFSKTVFANFILRQSMEDL